MCGQMGYILGSGAQPRPRPCLVSQVQADSVGRDPATHLYVRLVWRACPIDIFRENKNINCSLILFCRGKMKLHV